jgi:hypothetical protein
VVIDMDAHRRAETVNLAHELAASAQAPVRRAIRWQACLAFRDAQRRKNMPWWRR